MKKLFYAMICAGLLFGGCSAKDSTEETSSLIQFAQPQAGDYIAEMETTMGTIKIHLFSEQAPKAVENFVTHAKAGYYDGLKFHRVIQDFMVQGGDPNGNGTGGESIWGEPFEDEFSDQLFHFHGALSMANAGPDTNGSQFFIVTQKTPSQLDDAYFEQVMQYNNFTYTDVVKQKYQEIGGTPHLDQVHTVFGQVIEGMDNVEKISMVETDQQDAPVEDITINKITIEEVK